MKRTIHGINKADYITVEMKPLVSDPPSASLSILRHGCSETIFSLYELAEICEAIQEMKFLIEHPGPGITHDHH